MDKNKFMDYNYKVPLQNKAHKDVEDIQSQLRRVPSNEAVQVVVRCRPMNAKEIANDYKKVVDVFPSRGVIEITNPRDDGKERKKSFTFDAVYDADSTQEDLYNETVHPLVSSILDGFNGTIFAYGQTGTGKTYTMEGSKTDNSQKGIILRSFDQIFNYISRSKNMQYLVRTSYLEIYQEEIRDLLNKNRRKTYELREAAGVGVYVKDLSSFVCKSAKEIEHVMYVGNQNRSIGATNMNDHSSRSHAIFMITIEMSDTEAFKKIIRVGKLNLIDLAGSERQSKTGATGERLKEASKINLSLSALGNVISALVDGKNPHIPYRDSKLTRILQDSLGGNSKTIMVANIGPASYNYDETLTTLRYANRAKNIKNKPRVNEDPKDALLREYQMEIARLKGLLAERARQRELLLASQVKEKEDIIEKSNGVGLHGKETSSSEDKLRLMKELEEKKELLAKEKYASEKLEMKIAAMESKLLCGGKNIIDHTNEQQRALEQRSQEIAERKKREVEIRQKLELQEESALEIRDTYSTLQQEVDYKTKKLKKLFSRLQSIKQEIHDVTEEFNADRRELEAAHNELLKDLKVRYLIIDNFIPADEKTKVLLRARYDESDGTWYLLPFVPDNIVMVKRPVSSDSERRPVSDYGRVAIRVGRSHRYQGENILNLDLEPHPRTTSDYTGPIIAPKIHALLEEAMREEDDLDVDAAPLSNTTFGAKAKVPRKDREKDKHSKGTKARKRLSMLKVIEPPLREKRAEGKEEKFQDRVMSAGKLPEHSSCNTTPVSETSRPYSQVTGYSRFSPRVQELLSRRASRSPEDCANLEFSRTTKGASNDCMLGRATDFSYTNCCGRLLEEHRRYLTMNPVPTNCPILVEPSAVWHSFPVDDTSLSIWHSSQGQEDEILFNSFQFLTGVCCIIYLIRIAYILQIVVCAVISLLNS